MSQHPNRPELLAPAGNLECLHAAVTAGADAVYLGLDEFNARRNAGNFTLESLVDACGYAHLRGVAVYVAMNVEILPSELCRAVDVARRAWEAGADAFIVQDIGLARELARMLPQAPLHVSTQMNVHNMAGIAAAARLGASRVTLARELSLPEVAELSALAADFGMEVECFAHGALCVCYSGQCLMSSMIGGRSANRGLCAQACRLPYELRREGRDEPLPAEGEHLLSPRDLCTIDILDDLAAAGVASLKVEGRMKSPDYVFTVVSVYREVLDGMSPAQGREALPSCHPERSAKRETEGPRALPAQPGKATDEQKARLAEAFSRGFTTAYLEGQRGNGIMSYGRPNNRGVFAGRVARAEGGVAHIVPEIELHEDDVLEFWTNRGHFSATAADAAPAKDGTVRVAVDQRAGKGDRVFRVRNAALAFQDDPLSPRIPVTGRIALRIGHPARIAFAAGPSRGEAEGPIVEPARTKPIAAEDVRAHVDRLGNTPFILEDLEVDLDDNVGIGFSQLHHLRADALSSLQSGILSSWDAEKANIGCLEGREEAAWLAEANRSSLRLGSPANSPRCGSDSAGLTAEPSLLSASESHAASSRPSRQPLQVAALVTNPGCARAARRAGAERIYVPLLNFRRGQAQLAGVRQDGPEQAGYPKQCVMVLPTVDHDPTGAARETTTPFDPWDYVREGKPVLADNLGDVLRALEMGALVEAGPHVPATNAATLRALADLGVSRVWLSPELTLGQIADLAQNSPVPLGLVVAGAQELMITEHCLLMSQGPCNGECEVCPRRSTAHALRDRKGYDFPVVIDMLGRSHLYNGIELDAVPAMPDLADIGISAVMVDTALMSKKEAESSVARAVRARDLAQREHRSVQKRQGATTGHLHRGVS